MCRSVALAVALSALFASPARADDPHDLFGVGKHKRPPPPPSEGGCDEPHTFGCATTDDPFDPLTPYALSTWLPATYLRTLPVADATHEALASYGLGANRDDAGVSFAGATGLENRWTIEGAPADSMRTGGVDTRVPLGFLEGITITAGGFSARDRTSTGGTIDATLRRGSRTHQIEATVWGGLTAASRARPVARGSFSLRRLTADAGPDVTAEIIATGPLGALLGGTAWYAAGIAPALSSTKFTWKTARLVDLDQDGNADGFPGFVQTAPVSEDLRTSREVFVPVMARTGWDRGIHHVELTLIGHASETTRYLANATLQAAGVDRTDWIGDGIATYRASWKRTHASIQLAWHRSVHRESAHDAAAAGLPQLLSAYVPSTIPEEPDLAALCHDNLYPAIESCAVPFGYFASGGAGPLLDLVGDRPTATADVTHRLDDRNTLRAGATLEDARLLASARFTGDEQTRSLVEGLFHSTQRYYSGSCTNTPGAPCNVVSSSDLRYRTRYTAAYIEDTFKPEDDIRVDGGLRWELMWVGPRLHFSNEVAPRGGIAWDVLGGGRSRVWTSFGRSYVALPAGIGPTAIRRNATVTEATTTLPPNPSLTTRDTDPGAAYEIAGGIEPMAQDELTAGIELGLSRTFRVTAWSQGRWLRRGLETTARGFDNPGRHDGLPARRASELVAAEIATTPTGKLMLRAGYLFGKTIGNYLGAYDPRTGVTNYNSTAFDQLGDGLLTSSNEIGRLPTDAGHRVYLEADRRGVLGPVAIEVSTRLSLSTGRPRDLLADTDIGVLNVIERGSVGRTPTLTQANVRLAAHWRGFDATLDVFNVFDRGAAVSLDAVYTSAFVRPIEGGTYQDVVFLKSIDGNDIGRRTAYGVPASLQAPMSAVLAVHHAF